MRVLHCSRVIFAVKRNHKLYHDRVRHLRHERIVVLIDATHKHSHSTTAQGKERIAEPHIGMMKQNISY